MADTKFNYLYAIPGIAALLIAAAPHLSSAQNELPLDHCAAVTASVLDAGFADKVAVHCDQDHAFLTSDIYPDHEMMTGIRGSNEQVPVPAPGYSMPVELDPTLTAIPKTRDAALAVAVNGVPIFDYTGGGEMNIEDLSHHQTRTDTLATQQLDNCGGHSGRGDDYHYHKLPNCMIEQMDNAGDNAIIAWAFDGFPLYGFNNPDGSSIAAEDLDICNGQLDPVFGYRYHASEEAPYIIQCLMGEVAGFDLLPRVGTRRPSGRPPRGGVDNLIFEENETGFRSMTYDYQGESYFINYQASDTENCFDFEFKTVTNGGLVETGEYCPQVGVSGRR